MSLSRIIAVDRSMPFKIVDLSVKGIRVTDNDPRSLSLQEVDLNAIRFETKLADRKDTRGPIRLDIKVYESIWNNQRLIPDHFKEKRDGRMTFLLFEGSDVYTPNRDLLIPCLFYFEEKWGASFLNLNAARELECNSAIRSAVL